MPTHEQEKVISYCLENIKRIQAEQNELVQNRRDARKYFMAEPRGDEQKGRSAVVTSDLADSVHWLLPNIMNYIGSASEVVSIEPQSKEDEASAELVYAKVNYDLTKRNNWFLFNYDWVFDSVLYRNGFVKATWEDGGVEESYENVNEAEYLLLSQNPEIEILEERRLNSNLRFLRVRRYTDVGYVKIYNVPPEEIGIPLNTRSISEARFLYHNVRRTKGELLNAYGKEVVDNLENAKSDFSNGISEALEDRLSDVGGKGFFYFQESDEYSIYECYYKDPDTGKAVIATICGHELLKFQENPYNRPPIFTHSAFRLPHRVWGMSLYDLVKDIQNIQTALWRNILDNMYFCNNGRYVVDPIRVEMDDLINNNRPGGIIRTRNSDIDRAVRALEVPSFNPIVISILENVATMREQRSGIPRFNQGITNRSLHRTYRGTAMILSSFSERVGLISKLIVEGISELVNFVVDTNIKFMRKPSSIRIFNKWIDISPDNIRGRYDITVNVGMGNTSREAVINQMQQLLGILKLVVEGRVDIVTPMNIYNVIAKLIETMGQKNVDAFLTNPKETETLRTLLAGIQQAIAQGNQKTALSLLAMLTNKLVINYIPTATAKGEEPPTQPMYPYNPDFLSDEGFNSQEIPFAGTV